MKTAIKSIGIITSVLLSFPILAGQVVDKTLEASKNSFIRIEHVNGSAEIKGWNKNEVRVTGELGERTKEFIFEQRGDEIRIEVEVESRRWGSWTNSSDDEDDLTIYLPMSSAVSYESINASVELQDLQGTTQVEVVNGKIDAKDVQGRLRIESVNGAVALRNVAATLTVETVNGDIRGEHKGNGDLLLESVNGNIRMTSSSEDVRTESVNGDIELQLSNVDSLDMTSVNGDMDVAMILSNTGEVNASTVGGRIEMAFQSDISARFNIEGHAGGKIVNRITDDKMQKAKYGPRRWLNFSTGSSSARVDLSTVNGRIEVSSK